LELEKRLDPDQEMVRRLLCRQMAVVVSLAKLGF
jgi:hypothetical protein